MQTFNNVQMNGRWCSPEHGPAHFTVLKTLLIWMVWSFSKTFELVAGPCSPKHGQVPFTVLKSFFVWMLCSYLNTFKLIAAPRSTTISVTAKLISRRWRIVSFWCYADIQQRSIERTFVLPQTRSRAFYGVEEPFSLDELKLFKNIRTCGWAVLPQTRLSSVHGAEESICMDVLQPGKNIQVYNWAAHPNISCHGPAHFAALKNRFVLQLCKLSTTFKWTDGRAPPITVERISRFWGTFFLWMVSSFWKTFELMAGPCSPQHGLVLFTVLKNLFVSMLCSHLNTFKLMAGPRCPTSPVTAQIISRRWRIVLFWCYADIQQRSNERTFVLPQTRSRAFHGVEELFRQVEMKLFKYIRTDGWVVLPQTRPSSVHGVEESICMDVLQPCKNIQVDGWAAPPNIPCYGPTHFATLKIRFVL